MPLVDSNGQPVALADLPSITIRPEDGDGYEAWLPLCHQVCGRGNTRHQAHQDLERAIREVFLNNTVQPFSDVVSVEAFGAVIGHPAEEWEQLLAVYARACEATEAHDTPGERQLPLPAREELLGDGDGARVVTEDERDDRRRQAHQHISQTYKLLSRNTFIFTFEMLGFVGARSFRIRWALS